MFGEKRCLQNAYFDSRSETVPSLANDRFRANDVNCKVSNIRDTTISRSESISMILTVSRLARHVAKPPLIVVELGEVEPSLFLFPHVHFFFFSFRIIALAG